jgi:hypothetical protein
LSVVFHAVGRTHVDHKIMPHFEIPPSHAGGTRWDLEPSGQSTVYLGL